MNERIGYLLAGAVFSALLSTSAAASATTVVVPGDASGESVEVHVRSTEPGVTIAEILQETSIRSYGLYGSVGAKGSSWRDICIAPCTFRTRPGYLKLRATGGGGPETSLSLSLQPNSHVYLVSSPGSIAGQAIGISLLSLGIGLGTLGGIFYVMDRSVDSENYAWALPLAIGGVSSIGVGIGLMVWSRSSLEEEVPDGAPSRRGAATSVPLAVRYSGAF